MCSFLSLMLWTAAFGVARAQEPSGMDAIDVDVDLGSETETFSYEGGYNQRSSKVLPTVSVSISHPGGTVVVRCADSEFIESRVAYVIDGNDKGPMESFGNGIRLATWGEGASGTVKLQMPSRPAGVKTYKVDLFITVPKTAKLNINASSDWIQVMGCNGNVTANAGRNGVYVDGALQAFNVTAGTGDVKVVVEGDTRVSANSSLNATAGNATLVMAIAQNLQGDARGASVAVAHNVSGGTVTGTAVSGTIGSGGPTLNLRASGAVLVTAP
jgi:hypothetical protein